MKTCGIDLGTTNSCICVVAEDGYDLVTDEYQHATFPSVVYMGRDGKLTVGNAAKNRMGEFPGPVATIKRKMGSSETVMLGDEEKKPVEVSAMILRYLKELAEKQTGEEIDRAVVTVPAYFNHVQRQQTDEAGKQAGFREVITLLEPVAAALAYSLSNDAAELRVFVYDLGGGTFDATVLEKDAYGGLTVLSFGGDAFLGGDDVDARLARLLMQKLTEIGYKLDLDLDQPEDYSRFQRLKFLAELAKKELSERTEMELVHQGFMEDQEGSIVDIDLLITRAELETCARDLIERSIDASLQTLEKNNLSIDTIDEIIMVGGMSRMPLTQRMLADALGRDPKVVDPDLIVARGAAIKAAEAFAEQEVAPSGLRLELHFDRRTDEAKTRISGRFDRPLDDFVVYLLTDTLELSQRLNGTDRFFFEHVPLMPERENVFTLSVEDVEENAVIEREISITHESGTSRILTSPGSVVTKPLQIWTVDGLEVLFSENMALPHTVTHTFETTDQSGRIVAPIWEGNHEVERLEIIDIPPDLKIGTRVLIEISVEQDYQIYASARVPDLNREVKIKFSIDPVDTSDITPAYVRRQLEELDGEAQQAKAKCPSEEAVTIFQFEYRQVRSQIELELSEPEPKRTRLHEKLRELKALIQKLPSRDHDLQLTPTYEEFSERLRRIVGQARERNHKRLPEALAQIEALEIRAQQAWKNKDAYAWHRVNDQVSAIANMLRPELDPMEKALGLAAGIVAGEVPALEAAAHGNYAGKIAAIQEEATLLFLQVQAQLIDPDEASNLLIDLYQNRVVPLRRQLGLTTLGSPTTVDPAQMEGTLRKHRAG